MRVSFGRGVRGLILTAAIGFAFASPCALAADYYVDATNGRDTASGTSAEAAWQSLTKVSGFAYAAGDRIFFKRGENWRGQLRITRSGTAIAPISYGAYGSGALPTINGSQSITAWSDLGTNLYKATVSTRVEQLFFDGVRGTQESSVAALDAPGEWHWASSVLSVYDTKPPTGVEASVDQFGILVNNALHVKLSDLRVIRGLYPVWLQNTDYITLLRLTVEDGAGYAGIFVIPISAGRGSHTLIQQCTVTGMVGSVVSRSNGNDGSGIEIYGSGIGGNNSIIENIVHDNKHEGILLADSNGNRVRGNTVYHHGGSGIRAGLPASASNIIEFNTVYANARDTDDRYGIDLINVGDNNTVRFNLVHSQASIAAGVYLSGGIRFDGNDGSTKQITESTGNTAYYNLVYDEFTGINVFSFSNVSLYNNTVVDTKHYGIAVNAPDGITPVNTIIKNNLVAPATGSVLAHVNLENSDIDYNCYYFPPGATFIWGYQFLTYAGYLSQSGQDTHTLTGNALFLNPAARDYRLQAASPARDAGLDLGLPLALNGVTVPQDTATDIGAYEYVFIAPPEGEPEGVIEGTIEGITEGIAEGLPEGMLEGEGLVEGNIEGAPEGIVEGTAEGVVEGLVDGEGEGVLEGIIEGEGQLEGEGIAEGEGVAEGEGTPDGEGLTEGILEGQLEGEGETEAELPPDVEFDFSASVTSGAAPLPVSFSAEARKTGKSHYPLWAWDFGDGAFDSGPGVSHVYDAPGTYTVTLSIITPDGVQTVIKPEYIAVETIVPLSTPGAKFLLILLLALSVFAGRATRRRAAP